MELDNEKELIKIIQQKNLDEIKDIFNKRYI